MNHNLESHDGLSEPDFSDLMRDLVWTPGYRDADAWFSPASATAEGIVIHETSGWPTALAGFGDWALSVSDETVTTDGAAHQETHLPKWILRHLLDAKAGRLVRGYLAVGRSLPCAHVLCCALAADANRRSGHYASIGDSLSIKESTSLRTPARSYWRRVMTCGPFEFLVAIGFVFETLLAERLDDWEKDSRAAWSNRRAELGREVLHFILDQDPSNRLAVQSWLDRWAPRCAGLFSIADEVFFAANPSAIRSSNAPRRDPFSTLAASLANLAPYGISLPAGPAMQARSRALA